MSSTITCVKSELAGLSDGRSSPSSVLSCRHWRTMEQLSLKGTPPIVIHAPWRKRDEPSEGKGSDEKSRTCGERKQRNGQQTKKAESFTAVLPHVDETFCSDRADGKAHECETSARPPSLLECTHKP
jgi:hypothetical protein